MKIKLVKIAAITFTLVTIGYMSVSMSADTQSVGGKGLSVGEEVAPAAASDTNDNIGSAGDILPKEAEKEAGGCCSK